MTAATPGTTTTNSSKPCIKTVQYHNVGRPWTNGKINKLKGVSTTKLDAQVFDFYREELRLRKMLCTHTYIGHRAVRNTRSAIIVHNALRQKNTAQCADRATVCALTTLQDRKQDHPTNGNTRSASKAHTGCAAEGPISSCNKNGTNDHSERRYDKSSQ